MNRLTFLLLYFIFMGLIGYCAYTKIVRGGPTFEINFKTMEDMTNGNLNLSTP